MKILDPSWVQMMSIEKSALNKSCSSGSKLYSSWEHLLCCSPWSPQFFRRHLRFLLGTLFYRNLALLFQWLLKLSHAGVGLDEHFGSHEAKAFEATLWVEPCYHLIHVTQQARSELDSFWMKQNWKMCPESLPNALQLLVGTRSVGQPPTGVQPGVRCSALRSPVCARSCGAAPLALAGTAFPSVQGAAGPHLDALHKVWIQSPLKSLNDFHWL